MEITIKTLFRLLGKVSIIYFLSIIFICCAKKNKTIVLPVSSSEYTRDSIFISYAANQLLFNFHPFYRIDDYYDSTKPHSIYTITIDTILYSPEKDRFVSLIIYQYDTSSLRRESLALKGYADLNTNLLCDGRILIGYKDTSRLWKLCDFNPYIPLSFYSMQRIKESMRHFYFETIKDRYLVTNNEKGNVKYKYGINEIDFWDKKRNVVWMKGFTVKDKYPFELYSNDEILPEKMYKISYPNWIIDLYN